jgi:hypothetical protein
MDFLIQEFECNHRPQSGLLWLSMPRLEFEENHFEEISMSSNQTYRGTKDEREGRR